MTIGSLSRRSLVPIDEFFESKEVLFRDAAIVFAFLSVTIAFATTTNSSRVAIEFVRILSVLALFAVVAVLAFKDQRVQRSTLLAIGLFALFFLYGLVLAVGNGGLVYIEESLLRDFLLTAVLVYVFSKNSREIVSERAAKFIISSGVFVVALTIYYSGLDFSYPPRFHFEYSSNLLDRTTAYSQGVSKFYGLLALVSAYLSVKAFDATRVLFYVVMMLFFLMLSALGGARGDSLAAIFLALGYVFVFGKISQRFILMGLASLLFGYLAFSLSFSDFTLVARLQSLDGGMGAREDLYLKALELVGSNSTCSYFGCGFAYFQKYYGLGAAYYPHNFFLELVIVFGIPLSLILIALAIGGVIVDGGEYRSRNHLFLLVLGFFFLIQLKSGALLSAWWLMAGVFWLGSRALSSMSAYFSR
ncbi:hypothetical protein [Thauera aminoaromatica]|uniref:hypothetical protein n=1 Tax=Thauera aminoaromatica TaxID=164330 RepID=UPI0012FCFE95|nr:hypothetical protein [Thauera aminoaromatica]